MEFIKAKQILSSYSSGDFWFGCNYNMNIYKGCSHGCIYCDSRSDCYQVKDFDRVRAKENTLCILENELKSKRKKGIIGTGAMSDPYNPMEANYKLTRGALELIYKYQYGIGILTKSDLVLRDIDILKKISTYQPAMVNFTITTFSDELTKIIEPRVSLTSARFKGIKTLKDAGIYSGVVMMPILPFINDNEENIISIIRTAKENGADFVYPAFGVTLRQNQREYFYNQLDKYFPGLTQKYIHIYNNQYECSAPRAFELSRIFKLECLKQNMPYKMEDIIKSLKKLGNIKQLSIFDL